ncbi:hypothetical protein Ancab_005554 [Ancistrocladus abbreviatus]
MVMSKSVDCSDGLAPEYGESLGFPSLGLTFERVGPSGSRALAVSKEVSSESEDNTASSGNGFCVVSEDSVTVAEANSSQNQSSTNALDDSSKLPTPLTIGFGSGSGIGTGGGTRAGLFRTPISGGVQSAASAHGLARPALAVRNLMEQICSFVHCDVSYAPLTTRVSIWFTDPIFSFSPLAIHTRNLLADPRCTLVVQALRMGWEAHIRHTYSPTLDGSYVHVKGDNGGKASRIWGFGEGMWNCVEEWAHKQYIAKHQQGPSQHDIYFIGGFGTIAWVDVKEFENLKPDKIAIEGGEQYLKELNATFSKLLKELLSAEIENLYFEETPVLGGKVELLELFGISRDQSFHVDGGNLEINEVTLTGQKRINMLNVSSRDGVGGEGLLGQLLDAWN